MNRVDQVLIPAIIIAVVALIFSLGGWTGATFAPSDLPGCADNAAEDVVVYRSHVPGAWDACAAADDLVAPR